MLLFDHTATIVLLACCCRLQMHVEYTILEAVINSE